ncbi:MAG TPA: hypothetical protein VLM89_07845 [Phycisphaerae bacterium]|nr:hypothetical protein [Phycisphaerae bacterium]
MKLHDYTYQTGYCLIHDTDSAILGPDIYEAILGLIRSGAGPLAGVPGVSYRFTDVVDLACLSVETQAGPLWLAQIVPYRRDVAAAVSSLDGIAESLRLAGMPVESKLPDALATPCVVTLLLPALVTAGRDLVELLGGVPRDFACVWLADKFGM